MNEAGHVTSRSSALFLVGWMAVILVGLSAFAAFAPCVACKYCDSLRASNTMRVMSWLCPECMGHKKLTLLQYWKCECPRR